MRVMFESAIGEMLVATEFCGKPDEVALVARLLGYAKPLSGAEEAALRGKPEDSLPVRPAVDADGRPAYLLGYDIDYTTMDGSQMYDSMRDDGREWARAFCQIAAKNTGYIVDEGWMTSWFCNAIEISNVFRRKPAEAATSSNEKLMYLGNNSVVPGGRVTSTARKGRKWFDLVKVGDVVDLTVTETGECFGKAAVVCKELVTLRDVLENAHHNHVAYGPKVTPDGCSARTVLASELYAAYGELNLPDEYTVLHVLPLAE